MTVSTNHFRWRKCKLRPPIGRYARNGLIGLLIIVVFVWSKPIHVWRRHVRETNTISPAKMRRFRDNRLFYRHSSRIRFLRFFFKIQKTLILTFLEVAGQKNVKTYRVVQVFTFVHFEIAYWHFRCKAVVGGTAGPAMAVPLFLSCL